MLWSDLRINYSIMLPRVFYWLLFTLWWAMVLNAYKSFVFMTARNSGTAFILRCIIKTLTALSLCDGHERSDSASIMRCIMATTVSDADSMGWEVNNKVLFAEKCVIKCSFQTKLLEFYTKTGRNIELISQVRIRFLDIHIWWWLHPISIFRLYNN